MNKGGKKWLVCSGILFLGFLIFTLLVKCVDRQPIGPEDSEVGFAAVNGFVFELFGVNHFWYNLTEWMGVIAIGVVMCFGAAGLYQLVKQRSLRKVEGSLLALGGVCGLVMGFYLLFEVWVINYRPVMPEGVLEPSYPSSHTMLVMCIMATAAMQLRILIPEKQKLCRWVDVAAGGIIVVTIIGRLLSGVHWFTDIVGGVLLSAALIALHRAGAVYMKVQI